MNILIFFYTVICSDYRKAIKISNQKNSLKNQSQLTHSHDVICAFSSKVASLTISIGREYGKILAFSHRTPEFFGYSNADFNSLRSMH
jgi:hypothetical protein